MGDYYKITIFSMLSNQSCLLPYSPKLVNIEIIYILE